MVVNQQKNKNVCLNFFKDFIYLFLERGEEKMKERERNIDVRNTSQLPLTRYSTDALTENRSIDPLLCRARPRPLGHTGQGYA